MSKKEEEKRLFVCVCVRMCVCVRACMRMFICLRVCEYVCNCKHVVYSAVLVHFLRGLFLCVCIDDLCFAKRCGF